MSSPVPRDDICLVFLLSPRVICDALVSASHDACGAVAHLGPKPFVADLFIYAEKIQRCTIRGPRTPHLNMGFHELVLDRDVRDWVFIPLTLFIVLMKLMTQYVHQVHVLDVFSLLLDPRYLIHGSTLTDDFSCTTKQQGHGRDTRAAGDHQIAADTYLLKLHARKLISHAKALLRRQGGQVQARGKGLSRLPIHVLA